MTSVYVNSNGSSWSDTSNIRQSPSTSAPIVGTLSSLGRVANYLNSFSQTDGVWHNYKFSGGITGWIRSDVGSYAELKPSVVTLSVPFHSQNHPTDANDHPNDCGPASVAMVLGYLNVKTTVDEVSRRAGLVGSNFSTFAQLQTATASYGQTLDFYRPFHLSDVIAQINNRYPVLCLVNNAHLIAGKNYGHFVVVVGYDGVTEQIIYHDPNTIANRSVPFETFAKALGNVPISGYPNINNMPFQASYIKSSVTVPSLTVEERLSALERDYETLRKEMDTLKQSLGL